MTVNRQQTRWQRVAAWSALFAILLIVVAPFYKISQSVSGPIHE
jgi:uncharacterized membrane protein